MKIFESETGKQIFIFVTALVISNLILDFVRSNPNAILSAGKAIASNVVKTKGQVYEL